MNDRNGLIAAFVLLMLCASKSGSAQETIKTDTLSFVFEGKKFTGLLDLPGDQKPAGLIILIPGSGRTTMVAGNGYYKKLRNHFAEDGFACYVWDKAGCGKSEGIYDDRQSVANSAQEAIAAVEELKRLHIPGSDRIGLWGLSRGGWVCPLIIADYPSITFWISVSGPDDKENTPYLLETNFRIEGRSEAQTQLLVSEWKNGNDIFRKGGSFEVYQKATENLRRDSFWLAVSGQQYTKEGFERTQKKVMKENHQYDTETGLRIYVPQFGALLSKISCPVLAIFGEKDSQVDWKKTMTLYNNTIGKNPETILTVKTFPNGNHNLFKCETGGFMEKLEKIEFCDSYFETMDTWLKENKVPDHDNRYGAEVKTLKGKKLSRRQIDSFIACQMDSLKIPALSLAIIQNGKIVYYKATGTRNYKGEAIDSNTMFEAASMTKPVFAYAVHKLVQEGRMNLDTPLYRYYPYEDIDHDDRYKLITARMALSHTTGFPNWRGGGGSELTINFEPGTKYGYSGEGFEYLSLVVRHMLNKSIQDIMRNEVLQPLSIGNSFLISNKYVRDHLADGLRDNKEWGWNNPYLKPNVAFSLYTEAREYAKFVIRLMNESHSPQSVFRQMSVPQMEIEPGKWVCLGLFMEQTPYGRIYGHSGNNNRFSSNFQFYEDHDLGCVFFMNCHQEPAFTKRLNDFLENGQ